MFKKIIFTILIIFAIGAGAGLTLRKIQAKKAEKVKKTEEAAALQTQQENENLVLSGKVKAETQTTLKFQTSGKLIWVGVKEGEFVKKYQALASLDKRELEKKFQKEMNDYMNERWDFEQTQDDYKTTKEKYLVTDAVKRILEKAQFDLNTIVLDAEIAKLAMEFSTLVTPIEGLVTHIDEPIPGVNITPATATFTVVDPQTVYFEAEADEEEVINLAKGAKAVLRLDAYSDKEFASEIIDISFAPIAGKTTTTYAVKFTLPANDNLQFKLEMNGEAEIVSSE